MRYFALATDYDGTLAEHGRVTDATVGALERLRSSGRKLILVTGRELTDLLGVFPQVELFDRVVAENGALVYDPATREEQPLADPLPGPFVESLRRQDIQPLSVGRVIVATWEPHETAVLRTIRDLGLELQVIFNKGAVMVLPSGLNKATGLTAVLRDLHLSPHNLVGIGDAENDHAFLRVCEASAAVANALPALKKEADLVTRADHGAGVAELIERLLASDLRELEPKLVRHELQIGTREDIPGNGEGTAEEVRVKPYGTSILLSGSSGTGKSTFATGFLEQLAEHRYQFCVLDPEGDYENFAQAVVLGSPQRAPLVEEVIDVLRRPRQNAIVNLLGVPMADRPAYLMQLLPELMQMQSQTGRPHWLVVDEAHHLLPAEWEMALNALPPQVPALMLITVYPERIAREALSTVETLIAVGESPEQTIQAVSQILGEPAPPVPRGALRPGQIVAWYRAPDGAGTAFPFHPFLPRTERRRHRRKYAEGDVYPERSFYFQGPENKLNLRAQNLTTFGQLAEGIDDDTWLHHLHKGDYSRWFREVIKDPELADEADRVEKSRALSPKESRARILAAIEERYTAPT